MSDRARNYILNYEFPKIVHGYFEALSDLISFANTSYNFGLIPEKIYSDRFGKVCASWIVDEILLMFRNQRVGRDAREMTVDEFIKYAEGINNPDFVATHGREMNFQERSQATAAKRTVRNL